MYPTLYHLVADLLGLSIGPLKLLNMFGFMVALAFLAGALALGRELERKQSLGQFHATQRPVLPPAPPSLLDVALSGFIAYFIGLKLGGVAFGGADLQGGTDAQRYLLSWRGHVPIGIGVGLGWAARRYVAYRKLAAEVAAFDHCSIEGKTEVVQASAHVGGITGAAALGGFLGAKLFHWLEAPERIVELFRHPSLGALFGGLTIYGGLLGGGLFVWRYARKHGFDFRHMCDATAPSLMLAYGVGRMGCQLAGDGDWGIDNTAAPPSFWPLPEWAWAFDFPNNVLGAGVPMAEGGFPGYGTHLVPSVYPTPLYESVAALLLFALLWAVRKRLKQPLQLFGLYMLVNGFERFWIEKIRVNARYSIFGFEPTQAELIAVAIMIVGTVLLLRRRSTPAEPPTGAARVQP